MATIDEVKEFIGFLKLLFVTFVAMDVSIVAWLVKNYASNALALNLGALALIVIFSISMIMTAKTILKKIKYLKEL